MSRMASEQWQQNPWLTFHWILIGLWLIPNSCHITIPIIQYIGAWNPNDPCFDWKRPCFGGLTFKNRGHLGSRWLVFHPLSTKKNRGPNWSLLISLFFWESRSQLLDKWQAGCHCFITYHQKLEGNISRHLPSLKLTSSHLRMDGWNTSFLWGWPVFRGELLVSGKVFYLWSFTHLWKKTPEPRKKPSYFLLYWMVNRDPYFMVYYNALYNWVVFHPYITQPTFRFFSLLTWKWFPPLLVEIFGSPFVVLLVTLINFDQLLLQLGTVYTSIHMGVEPKIGVVFPQKWMVYNGKPY